MKNKLSEEIYEKIKSAEKILIPLHRGPDGDSLGCSVAMRYFLERDFNKNVKIISHDELSKVLSSFNFVREIEFGKGVEEMDLENFDLIIFLDHGDINYSTEETKLKFPKEQIINIDHHSTNTLFGGMNYIDDSRPSACSVLIDLFKKWEVNFDKELATRLLLGVYTDSGWFSHSMDAIFDAAFLIEKNADYIEGIVKKIKYNVPLNLKKYYAFLVNKFKIINFESYNIGVCSISKKELDEFNLNLSEVRSGLGTLQEIGGIDFLFTLNEMENMIKGSFRSENKIDVSLFAKELGGGGHKAAAAFRFNPISLEEAEKKVWNAIEKVGIHKTQEL